MYLLAVLRFLFGLLPRVAADQGATILREAASGRRPASYSPVRAMLPHEWTSMDPVWTKGPPVYDCRGTGWVHFGRGTFDANHSLHSVFRLVRRLAGRSETYPALAVAVCLARSQSPRRR